MLGECDRHALLPVREEDFSRTAIRADAHVLGTMLAGAEQMAPVLDGFMNRSGRLAKHIYCVFEKRNVEPELALQLSSLAGIWVQCRANERVLKSAGLDNVSRFPYPLFNDDPHLALDVPDRQPRVFYAITRFEPRKAPDEVVRAFMTAFKPGEAELVVKCSPLPHKRSAYPTFVETVSECLGKNGWNLNNWNDSIRFVTGKQTRSEMVELHARGDVYVTASRGEGLDLPCWEAKLSGRRVITPASGGPEDFMGEDDIVLPVDEIDAHECYELGPGAKYAAPRFHDLVAAMQRARSEPWKGSKFWEHRPSHAARFVGAALREWLS